MARVRLCFSTYAADMNEYGAPKSNSTTIKVSLTKKHTNDNVRNFLGFLHSNMADSSMSIVRLSSNRNRVDSIGRRRCRHNYLRRAGARIGALVGVVTSLTTSIALSL
jgi:hypothetical protein